MKFKFHFQCTVPCYFIACFLPGINTRPVESALDTTKLAKSGNTRCWYLVHTVVPGTGTRVLHAL